jgi:hypothetical protein
MRRRVNTIGIFVLILCFHRLSRAEKPTQAMVVEAQADSVCSADCPPIPLPKIYGIYVYCLKAGDEVLIGEHQMWEMGLSKLAHIEGQSLPTHWDQRHIWVTLPNGWIVRLNQYNYEYSFHDKQCSSAARLRSFQHGYTRPGPVPGEPAQPVMHGELVYGWALCSRSVGERLLPITGESQCKVWDLEGRVRQDAAFRAAPRTAGTQWSDSSDGEFLRLHLKDGRELERVDSHQF